MKARVEVDDRKWRDLLKRVKGIDKKHVLVGVLASAGEAEGGNFSLAELAAVHEYGSPAAGIPERSFIRSTFAARKDEMGKQLEAIARSIVTAESGETDEMIEQGLDKLGLWVSTQIKNRIRLREIVPRLEDSEAGLRTIERKGSDLTLVDTGQLLNAISWQVVGGDSE